MRTAQLSGPCLLLALACGPSPGTTSADTGTTSAASTSDPAPTTTADETATTSHGSTTAITTTTDPGTTSGTTAPPDTGNETASDTDTTTGDPACGEPDADEVVALWDISVNGGPPPETVSAPCIVTASDVAGPQWTLGLDCTIDGQAAAVELLITRTPESGPTVSVGTMWVLEYRAEQIFWTNEWFAIHVDGNTLLVAAAGIKADDVAPPGTTAEDFFGVAIHVVDGLCAPIDRGPCGPTIRLALDMTWSAANKLLFDGQQGALIDLGSDVGVWVAAATRPSDRAACDDVPPAWFEVVMAGNFGP